MDNLRVTRSRLGDAYRAARASVAGSALVLTYHRVIEVPHDPESLTISPAAFERQIETLSTHFNVLTASDLCGHLERRKRIPRRSVAITFDDGYFDLLAHARPVLERYGTPATAFVSTAEIGTARERWWDEIAYLCSGDHPLPSPLAFEAAGRTFESEIDTETRGGRESLYAALIDHVWPLGAAGRSETLDALFREVELDRPTRPEYRSLGGDELRELARGGLVEIGAHTVSHQMLSTVCVRDQRSEIEGGKAALEGILGMPVTLFSYPYGGRGDIGSDTRSLVEQAGFRCAFANWFGLVFPWTDRYLLPRCPTGDFPATEFREQLEQWFRLGR